MSAELPPAKKVKTEPKDEPEDDVADQVGSEANEVVSEDPSLKDQNGDIYFEISKKRRCTVRSFKGNTLVDIREVRTFESSQLCCVNPSLANLCSYRCMRRTTRPSREKKASV